MPWIEIKGDKKLGRKKNREIEKGLRGIKMVIIADKNKIIMKCFECCVDQRERETEGSRQRVSLKIFSMSSVEEDLELKYAN